MASNMSITWTVDAAKRRAHITVTGPVTRDDAGTAINTISSQPGFESTFAVLIEAIGDSGPEFVRDVMYFLSTHRAKLQGARVAIVLGLAAMQTPRARMSEITAQWAGLPIAVRTFVTPMNAERWLSNRWP